MRTLMKQPHAAVLLISLAMSLGMMQPAAAVPQDNESQMPHRGMTMTQVEQRYGDPINRHATVGEPPITRWDYGSFVAYFERHRLLHAFIPRPVKN